MSSALTFATHLKAEIRLAQAVSEFEADLPADQKAAFRSERTRAGTSSPTTQDVMKLTAEIDYKVLKGRRCFGPRFTNVLHAVQKFASLGDVLVGGSQNLIACGVWTIVRMGILAIPNSFSIQDRLSNLFMAVGRSAPRYEKLALIYPQSHDLRDQLYEYYIIMVKLCHKLLKLSKKSTLEQLILPLSETELTRIQNELEQWATSIAREIGRLTAQEVKQESEANTKFRELSTLFSKNAARDLRLKTRARNLNACTTHDYETAWKRLRKLGKATIHHDNKIYHKWRDGSSGTTLIINGKLGSGKSVLMANIIDDLNLKFANTKVVIAYFFCQWDNQESLKAKTVIGSLLRQILQAVSDPSSIEQALTKELYYKESPLDVSELLDIFINADLKSQSIYCLLDNVGECPFIEVTTIRKALQRLLDNHNIHLCLSKRTEAQTLSFGKKALELDLPPMTNPDIEAFIDFELERCIENGSLNIGDASLVLEIHEALSKGAQGMFLWVALQIDSLCSGNTDAAIRDLLKNLPKTLAETFSRILNTSETSEHVRYQRPLFNLVLAAMRPLDVEEIREALSVEPGNVRWDRTRLINNIQVVVASCGGLLITDEEDLTVRLVHPSVKQFLISPTEEKKEIFHLQKHMADIVVTYLNYSIFEKRIVKSGAHLDVQAVPMNIVMASLPFKSSKSLALRLLKQKKIGNVDISRVVADIQTTSPVLSHFLGYAKENLRHHAWTYLVERDDDKNELLLKILPDLDCTLPPPSALLYSSQAHEIAQNQYWDSDAGLRFMCYLNLHTQISGDIILELVDRSGETMRDWGLRLGYNELLRSLFSKDNSRRLVFVSPHSMVTPPVSIRHLHDCFKSGYLDLADEMISNYKLDLKGKITLKQPQFGFGVETTVMQSAIFPGTYPEQIRVIEILLKHHADCCFTNNNLPSAFFLALQLQEWKIAEIFFDAGADIDHIYGKNHRTMLLDFCSIDTAFTGKAIAWLVQHSANILSIDRQGRNILDIAFDDVALVQILRSAGVNKDHVFWHMMLQPSDTAKANIRRRLHYNKTTFKTMIQNDVDVVRWQDMDDMPTTLRYQNLMI